MVNQQPPAAKPRSRTRLLIQVVVSLVLVVAIFYFLLKQIDLAQVWTAITDMTWLELTLLGLLAGSSWSLRVQLQAPVGALLQRLGQRFARDEPDLGGGRVAHP